MNIHRANQRQYLRKTTVFENQPSIRRLSWMMWAGMEEPTDNFKIKPRNNYCRNINKRIARSSISKWLVRSDFGDSVFGHLLNSRIH